MEDALLGCIFQCLGCMKSDILRDLLAVSPARVPETDRQQRFGHSKCIPRDAGPTGSVSSKPLCGRRALYPKRYSAFQFMSSSQGMHDIVEGLPGDELHGEITQSGLLTDAIDRHDVCMVQRRCRRLQLLIGTAAVL